MIEPCAPTVNDLKDVYLCYNSADHAWVKNLAEQLESETIDGLPSSRRLRVFLDLWDIDAGANLIVRMNEGMTRSRYVATILSPEFMKAPWPTFEWTHIVTLDPMNVQKRIIPLLVRDVSLDGKERIDLCAPFRGLKHLDFRRREDFFKCYVALVRRLRGQPPERGALRPPLAGITPVIPSDEAEESWRPDKVGEVLLSNLLPVQSMPAHIWSAKTEARNKADVLALIDQPPGFILKEGRLFTFEDLTFTKAVLRKAVDVQTIGETVSSNEWLLRDDRRSWLMNLLNRCLTGYVSHLAIKQDHHGRYFFRPKDELSRIWQNPGDRSRKVAARKPNQACGGYFWVHHAARMKFRRIGERVFLQVEPSYLFTSDGEKPLEGQTTGKLSMMWGGRQKNVDILRNFIFWVKAIARSQSNISIETGGQPVVVSATPATSKASVGIEGDTVKIGSLLKQLDNELDDAAQDVVVSEDIDETTHEET